MSDIAEREPEIEVTVEPVPDGGIAWNPRAVPTVLAIVTLDVVDGQIQPGQTEGDQE